DLDLVADRVERPLLLEACEEVVIENCRIGQSDFPTPLLTVDAPARLRVQGCTLWSLHGLAPGDSDKADAQALDAPLKLLREVTGPEAPLAREGTLRITRWLSRFGGDYFSGFRWPAEEPVRALLRDGWQPADVLSLPDGGGSVTLEDNLIVGYVHLYGDEGELPWAELRELGVDVSEGRVVVGLEGGHLALRGNQLLGLRVDREVLTKRRPPRENEQLPVQEGTFRFCTLTDNRFALPGSGVMAAQLRVSSNQFDMAGRSRATSAPARAF